MKACLFDIDGTLLQTGGAGQRAFGLAFAREFGVERLAPEVSFAGRSDRGIAGDFFEHHRIENNQVNWERFREAYVELLPVTLADCDGVVLPGCLELIDRLERMGDVHIGLLTGNVRRGAERKLSHYGVWERFAFGGFGDHHPEREGIAAAAREAVIERHGDEVADEKIVVIGDTPNDVRCARAIGAYAVAVASGPTPIETLRAAGPDLLLESLADHEAIVAWLAA